MAKKVAKKQASAAKASKSAVKAVKKTAVKAAKSIKASKPVKAVATKKPVTMNAKAPVAKKEEEVKPPAKVAVKALAPEKAVPIPAVSVKTAKKEKKVKVDKSGLNDDQVKWHEYHERHKDEKAANYSISGQFEAKQPLQHKLFGWGFILSNEYDRLEVLFADGKRMLISNRKL